MITNYLTVPEITISYKDKVKASDRAVVDCSKIAVPIFRKAFKVFIQHHEEFWVMFLNRANKVLGIIQISKNGISETLVDIRLVMQAALKANATSIIVSHNHPSGNLKPSHPDKLLTKKIQQACDTLDIILLDHLILTSEGFMSFADEGLL